MSAHGESYATDDAGKGTYTAAIEWTSKECDLPHSSEVDVNPQEALVAAIARSHLLCFLEIAATFGYDVEHYSDSPEGTVAMNAAGAVWVAHVVLRPAILFTGAKAPTDAAVLLLHHSAHAESALANYVR